jgi:L,D-transpeptidase YcbB
MHNRHQLMKHTPTSRKVMQVWALLSVLVFVPPVLAVENRDMDVMQRIQYGSDGESPADDTALKLSDLHWPDKVFEFYQRRMFRAVWSTKGEINDQAIEFLAVIRAADTHGLRPGDYHIGAIARALSKRDEGLKDEAREELDLLLTDAWLTYGEHLLRGRVDPASLDSNWRTRPQEHDLVETLSRELFAGRAAQGLQELAPKHGGYKRLMELLAHYREVQDLGRLSTDRSHADPAAGRQRAPDRTSSRTPSATGRSDCE